MLQGQRDLTTVGRLLLTELTPLVNAHMGVIYQVENEENPQLRLLSAYAGDGTNPHKEVVQFGEGLVGQAAMDKRQRILSDIPARCDPDQFGAACASSRKISSCFPCCSKARSRP